MRLTTIVLLLATALPCAAQATRQPDLSEVRDRILRQFDKRLKAELDRVERRLRRDLEATLRRELRRLENVRPAPKPAPKPAPQPATEPTRPRGPGYLGVSIAMLSDEDRDLAGIEAGGLKVGSLVPRGPAARAGLRSGDILVKIDGQAISGADTLRRVLARKGAGQTVSLLISRRGVQRFVDVKLGAQPSRRRSANERPQAAEEKPEAEESVAPAAPAQAKRADGPPWIGVVLGPDLADRQRPDGEPIGIAVESLAAGGPAHKAGLREKDLILRLNGVDVANFADLKRAIGALRPGQTSVIEVRRRDTVLPLKIVIGAKGR